MTWSIPKLKTRGLVPWWAATGGLKTGPSTAFVERALIIKRLRVTTAIYQRNDFSRFYASATFPVPLIHLRAILFITVRTRKTRVFRVIKIIIYEIFIIVNVNNSLLEQRVRLVICREFKLFQQRPPTINIVRIIATLWINPQLLSMKQCSLFVILESSLYLLEPWKMHRVRE